MIYIAVFLEMVIALGIAVFAVAANSGGHLNIPPDYLYYRIGIGFFFLIMIFLILFLPRKILTGSGHKPDINEKILKYRNIYILKMVLIELIGLALIIFFFLFGDRLILIPVSVIFLLLVSSRPNLKKICNDLSLSEDERNSFDPGN